MSEGGGVKRMIIARDEEMKSLQELYQREDSQFIAIFGRRGIGKTFLVHDAFKDELTFEHTGLAGKSRRQELKHFVCSLRNAGMKEPVKEPKNWLEAFELLKDLIRNSKDTRKVIFIDELSWMDTKGSDLMIALEGFWNGWAGARKDIVLIVCASNVTWMTDRIIHNIGGLYNRLNLWLKLKPFTLKDCEEYLQSKNIRMSRQDILKGYMIMGGVPYYWSLIRNDLSLAQNIDEMFFLENAPLKNEFDCICSCMFSHAENYIPVLAAFGKEKAAMTRRELAKITALKNNDSLTKVLDDLENCGFIEGFKEYGKKNKWPVYQLTDHLVLFHFRFLENRTGDEQFHIDALNESLRDSWQTIAFEMVCFQHIAQIKKKLGISGVITETQAWRCRDNPEKCVHETQIDLMIVRRDRVINLCEMKYSCTEYEANEDDDKELRGKLCNFINGSKTGYAVLYTLISPGGLKWNMYTGRFHSVIALDDLFA